MVVLSPASLDLRGGGTLLLLDSWASAGLLYRKLQLPWQLSVLPAVSEASPGGCATAVRLRGGRP